MRDASKFLGESVDPEDPMLEEGKDMMTPKIKEKPEKDTVVTKSYVIENSWFEDLDDQL